MEKNDNDNELMTVCSRVGDGYRPPVTVGTENVCAACGHKIWVSNTTMMAVAQKVSEGAKLKHHCMECAMKAMLQDGDKTLMEMTPEQRREINDQIKKDG